MKYEEALGKLKKMTVIDELTGLYNRRYFEEDMDISRRTNAALLLILLDIDHFKQINDTYGHICGDIILRKVEDTIRQNVDEMDTVLQIGGEEFAFLCRNTLREDRKKKEDCGTNYLPQRTAAC
ncbi:GGDEF domain-containing protein [Bacillus sp. 37MA]|uniref:GGDEF domain-containing protein n=1 Tax=Bacillus sp. 37MA TaxID=1132442 RepID=UPI000378ABB7|nr:GGDEF domain-containing protein [Bacillus sp. 37MA]